MHPITKEQLAKFVGEQKSPCISLYMPTHRRHPENQRDPIGFKNLLQEIENTLRQRYPNLEMDEDLAKFHTLSHDDHFWNHRTDGLGILCSPDAFHVFDLQRPVEELLVVADSFHIKPLLRALQATDRYQILGLNRHEAKLYEGNRDALDEIEMNEGVPATIEEALGSELSEAHITVASYGGSGGGLHGVPSTHHGHGQKKDEVEIDNERFFRAIDRAILKHCSQSSKLPLILAALPEHHDLFRRVSHNPFLVEDGIRLDPQSISIERLRTEAWRVMEPHYQQRITKLVDNFEQSQSRQLGESDLMDIAQALIVNRKATPIADIGSGDSHQRFVLALNAGSSSLKIALFHGESEPVRLLSGAIDRIGLSESTFSVKRVGSQETEHATVTAASHASCLDFLLTRLFEVSGHSEFRAAVHRVVHGGPRYVQPEVVTPELLEELRRISPFAPEHLPSAIDLINALQSRFPQLTQIACFDTAFHHDLPRVALMMPIPRRYEALGVRYGRPHEQIVTAAKEGSVDLIVMGATGRTGLVRVLLGSTTRRLMRSLPCSLLTIKQEDALEELFEFDVRSIAILMAEARAFSDAGTILPTIAKYRQVLSRDPFHVAAMEGLASALDKVGETAEAESYRRRLERLRQVAKPNADSPPLSTPFNECSAGQL